MKSNTEQLTRTALFAAVIFLTTRYIQIPIPLGYVNPGNGLILFSCLFLSMPQAALAGGIGSALADLASGYPIWAIPTLLIKGCMPLLFMVLRRLIHTANLWMLIPSAAIALLVPVVGYTFTGAILYGSLGAGLAQVPGLLAEMAANGILFALLYPLHGKIKSALKLS